MKKDSFIGGTIATYLILLITKVMGVLYVIPFYKMVGQSGGVLYSYAYNVYNLLLNISTGGIPTAVCIIVAEYNTLKMIDEREYFYKVANRVIFILSVIAFLLMFIFAKQIGQFLILGVTGTHSIESITLVIRVISFCLLIVPFLSVTRGYLQGNEYIVSSSKSQLIEQFVRIFVVLAASYVALNIFNLNLDIGISFALSGTFVGAIVAYLYLKIKIQKQVIKSKIDHQNLKIDCKVVLKKIIKHAIPITIVAITQNIYEVIDFKLIIKGLYLIGYSGDNAELVASIAVTWAPKICMIINALALGLTTSIIPFIVSNYVKNERKKLNEKFNQSINIILFAGIPLALFMMIFSKEIYYLFYGESLYGSVILKVLAIVSILFSIHLVINIILQGIKKYKLVYLNTFIGIIMNTLFDIPLILLLNKLKFYPYIGSLIATLISQLVSIAIVLVNLKINLKFKYVDIFQIMLKIIFASIFISFILLFLKGIIFANNSYLLLKLGFSGLILVVLYIFITYKTKIIFKVFTKQEIDKILKRLKGVLCRIHM